MEWNLSVKNVPRDFLKNGQDFVEAAWRCFGGKEGIVIKDGKLIQLAVPTVVNASFACEMFLKALIMHEGKQYETHGKKGHDLKTLFAILDPDKQELIAKFCMPKGTINAKEQFLMILNNHSEDFVDVRYYVEKTGWEKTSPIVMITIAENLRIITEQILKNTGNNKSNG